MRVRGIFKQKQGDEMRFGITTPELPKIRRLEERGVYYERNAGDFTNRKKSVIVPSLKHFSIIFFIENLLQKYK